MFLYLCFTYNFNIFLQKSESVYGKYDTVYFKSKNENSTRIFVGFIFSTSYVKQKA